MNTRSTESPTANDTLENQKKSALNQKVILSVGVVDSSVLASIFVMFLSDTLLKILHESVGLILFPISASLSIVQTLLAWRQAALDRGKKGTLGKALVETAAASAIAVAVFGGAMMASIAPFIFTAVTGFKTVYHGLAAAYYFGKSCATTDENKRAQYRAMAYGNLVGAVASLLICITVSVAMIAMKPLAVIAGITACAMGVGYSLYNLLKKPSTPKTPAIISPTQQASIEEEKEASHAVSNNASLHKRFGIRAKNDSSATQPLLANRAPSPIARRNSEVVAAAVAQVPQRHASKSLPTSPVAIVRQVDEANDRRMARSL